MSYYQPFSKGNNDAADVRSRELNTANPVIPTVVKRLPKGTRPTLRFIPPAEMDYLNAMRGYDTSAPREQNFSGLPPAAMVREAYNVDPRG